MMFRPSYVLLAVACVAALSGCGSSKPPRPDMVFVSSRSGSYAIYAMNADGGRQRRLSHGGPSGTSSSPADLFFQIQPAWSPDGTSIAFSSKRTGTSQIYVMRADGTGSKPLTSVKPGASQPSWSPDGKQVAFVENDPGFVYVMRADGTGIHSLGANVANESDPAWSPDGSRLAVVRRTPGTDVTELWTARPDGAGLRQVTKLGAAVASPTWSPDGRRIAFASNLRHRFDIYVVNADGSGLRRLTTSTSDDVEPNWSPDGKLIVFSRDGAIATVDLARTVTELTSSKHNDSSPDWKPHAASQSAK
jgi:Tol biopolymer transport system component